MGITSFEELCSSLSSGTSTELSALLPDGIQHEVGHFNVFNLTELTQTSREKPAIPYACRAFYKINFLTGKVRLPGGPLADKPDSFACSPPTSSTRLKAV